MISQSIFIYLPGKNPHDFYVCTGRIPADLIDAKMKVNYSLVAMTAVAMTAHIYIAVRFKLFKKHENLNTPMPTLSVQLQITFKKINKETITNFTSNLIGVMLYFFASLPPLKINTMHSLLLNDYPNYLWIYAHHHVILVCVETISMLGIFYRVPHLRIILVRELKERFESFSSD